MHMPKAYGKYEKQHKGAEQEEQRGMCSEHTEKLPTEQLIDRKLSDQVFDTKGLLLQKRRRLTSKPCEHSPNYPRNV